MILLESNFCKLINPISETATALAEIVEKKVGYKVERKCEAERDLEDPANKLKAGAKTVANKADESYRDLRMKYKK